MNVKIVVDPNIHFGKPTISGTRITVQDILELINQGLSFDQIKADYFPDLSDDDIKACIDYAISLIAAEDIKVAARSFYLIKMYMKLLQSSLKTMALTF